MFYNLSIANLIRERLIKVLETIESIYNWDKNNLPIQLNKHPIEIIYKTPCCLQLAKYNHQNPLLVANQIANKFNHIYQDQDLIAQISINGWLEFIISDRMIEKWLNNINKNKIIHTNKIDIQKQKEGIKFINYYIHARCCSLLKSAHYQNIIQINNLDFLVNKWHIITPKKQDYYLFYLGKNKEQKTIKKLLLIAEKISLSKINYITSLNNLDKLFFEIESNSLIWGETLKDNLSLSQARLGLIAIFLHYYQNIFHAKYQKRIPTEI